jgi:hypothetical protein
MQISTVRERQAYVSAPLQAIAPPDTTVDPFDHGSPTPLLQAFIEEEDLLGEDGNGELEVEGIATDDPVRIYLREIGRVHLLTAQEETQFAQAIERGEEAAESLRRNEYAAEDFSALQRRKREGDSARERLIQANLRLVVSIAKKYPDPGRQYWLDACDREVRLSAWF